MHSKLLSTSKVKTIKRPITFSVGSSMKTIFFPIHSQLEYIMEELELLVSTRDANDNSAQMN